MDAVLEVFKNSLPPEVAALVQHHLAWLEDGDFSSIFESASAQSLFGKTADVTFSSDSLWNDFAFERLGQQLSDHANPERRAIYFIIGYAALLAFIQANVTGPPINFNTAELLFPQSVFTDHSRLAQVRQTLLAGLSSDGVAAYPLARHIELLSLADIIFSSPTILKNVCTARWARARVNFVHQQLLLEVSPTIQASIYDDLELVEQDIFGDTSQGGPASVIEFLLERAVVRLHYGEEHLARLDIEKAGSLHGFQYYLTGRLGKRTKFQQKDTSQLVVLAKSAAASINGNGDITDKSVNVSSASTSQAGEGSLDKPSSSISKATPSALDLNDDTLLERIAFSDGPHQEVLEEAIPPALVDVDPSDQPILDPIDSIILLSMASAITNTAPENGLTREEMLPYATRVLDGGSSNWQIYTQALLVRSRIEGYKSRTVERALLQLQALVDQVIVETDDVKDGAPEQDRNTTFLPRPKQDESAFSMERLRYIFLLASPTRWSIEAELAARWIKLGGVRSALQIFERLEMWADAALCLAATEQEDKAREMIKRQLFVTAEDSMDGASEGSDKEKITHDTEQDPLPADAARLYCILGDIDQSVDMYNRAWTVSGQRYARAQRSIGRFYFEKRDFAKSADAYTKSLKVNQLNQQSWFALGCALIEMDAYERAAEAFSRCVQLDEKDAESWSNMAAALLRIIPSSDKSGVDIAAQAHRNRQNALKAFQRAAAMKHDSHRIWQNVLVTAASLAPPDFNALLTAQRQIVKLRGEIDGEKCIDVDILERLVQHVVSSADHYVPEAPGVARLTVKFFDESLIPLITSSVALWRMTSKLAVWRRRPKSALEAEEKAWRIITNQPGWENESETRWDEVVEATTRLCNSYESLGPRELTEGLASGSGAVVASDWNFKARSAARSVANRAKSTWEGSAGWERLKEVQEDLKR